MTFDDDRPPDLDDPHAECRDQIEHLEATAERMRKMLIAAEAELGRLRAEIETLQRRRLGLSL
jgi:hypothetical protein